MEGFQLHGEALRLLRISNGLKGSEVASHFGVTRGHISNCENGWYKLSEKRTKQFLELIGTSEEEAKQFVYIINSTKKGGF